MEKFHKILETLADFVGGVRGICLHFRQRRKLRFASVEPSAATVHRTVAFYIFKSLPDKNKTHPTDGSYFWRSERDLNPRAALDRLLP